MASVCVLSACNAPSAPNSVNPTLVPTVASDPRSTPTATLPLRTITPISAPATRSRNLAEITLRWDVGVIIADIDDVSELAIRLRDRPGIVDAYGDEIQITVTYDPEETTPEKIRLILADLGFPTRKP